MACGAGEARRPGPVDRRRRGRDCREDRVECGVCIAWLRAYQRDGTLVAQTFDATRLQASGDPINLKGVAFNRTNGRGAFSVSDNGLLLYRSGVALDPVSTLTCDRKARSSARSATMDMYSRSGCRPTKLASSWRSSIRSSRR